MSHAVVRDPRLPPTAWRKSLAFLLAVLVVADLVAAIESSMIYAAFKAILQDTRDPIGAGWLVSAYFVVAGPAAVVAGRLGDIYGRKRVLSWVFLLVISGSMVSALSPTLPITILGERSGACPAPSFHCVSAFCANGPPISSSVSVWDCF